MKRNTQRQTGFTLVELLVVITIIGMLMALLLPAVNAAVEQARNLTCKNNMKNLTVACVSFESTNGRFPGYQESLDGSENPNDHNKPFIRGWLVGILPQLDHHDWYEEYRRQRGSLGVEFGYASDLLICPSNPPTTGKEGWCGYCINAGYWDPSGFHGRPPEDPATNPDGLENPADGIAHAAALEDNNGISLAVGTTMDYISANDGSSYTVIISENVSQTAAADNDWYKVANESTGNTLKLGTTMVWHLEAGPPASEATEPDPNDISLRLINNRGGYPALTNVPLNPNTARPSSYHTGGVNMAFCDQRVIFVRETIQYRVYQHLMTPNGRGSLNLPETIASSPLSDQEYQ